MQIARSIHDLTMRLAEDPRARLIRSDSSGGVEATSLVSILAEAKAGQLPTRAAFLGRAIGALSAAACAAEGLLGCA